MVALSPAELRKRNNFTLFVNRIKTNGYFTLNEGNGRRVQITQKFGYQLQSIDDLEKLRDSRGSILLPTGATGSSSIRLSQLYKDAKFVTRTQNTTAGERYEITQTRNQLEKIKQKVGSDFVRLKIGNNNYLVSDVESTPGTPKSDMNFIDNQGKRVGFVSLKQGATPSAVQQWGGVSPRAGGSISGNTEVQSFVQKVRELFPDGITPATTVAREIQSTQLQSLGIYGNGFGGSFGVNNVDVLLQGSVRINSINSTDYKITGSSMTHNNGDILPPLYQPALMAIYKGDRNDYGIRNARLVMNAIGGRRVTQMV